MLPIKIAFLVIVGPQLLMSAIKFPKKKIPFLEGYCQPHIKLFPFWDYYVIHQISFFGNFHHSLI